MEECQAKGAMPVNKINILAMASTMAMASTSIRIILMIKNTHFRHRRSALRSHTHLKCEIIAASGGPAALDLTVLQKKIWLRVPVLVLCIRIVHDHQ